MAINTKDFQLPINLDRPRKPQKRQRKPFLKGPIPLAWLQRVAELPGKSPLAVALAVWHQAGLKKTHHSLRLCPAYVEHFGLQRRAAYNGLRALEQAGLVSVSRKAGQCARVTILSESVE